MMRVDGAWKPAEAVRDPRGPIWPSTPHQSEDSCPSYDDLSARFDGEKGEGVGRGEVAQVRHGACGWSLETCRGCAGPPGPDLAKRDLNPRIPARVMTISVRVRCGGAGGGWMG